MISLETHSEADVLRYQMDISKLGMCCCFFSQLWLRGIAKDKTCRESGGNRREQGATKIVIYHWTDANFLQSEQVHKGR